MNLDTISGLISRKSWRLRRIWWQSLFFLHIGKTAGTSFSAAIDRLLPASARYPHSWISEGFESSEVLDYCWFRGHFPYDLKRQLRPPVASFTILREPMAQSLSAFKHLARVDDHPIIRRLGRPIRDLDDYLSEPLIRSITLNPQTFALGADVDLPQFMSSRPDELERICFCEQRDEVGESHLARAKHRLLHEFTTFGIVERSVKSHRHIFSSIGLSSASSLPRLNEASHRSATSAVQQLSMSDLTRRQERSIRERLELDFQLYDFACNLFDRRLAA